MKVISGIVRSLTHPVGAVVTCGVLAGVLWLARGRLGLERPEPPAAAEPDAPERIRQERSRTSLPRPARRESLARRRSPVERAAAEVPERDEFADSRSMNVDAPVHGDDGERPQRAEDVTRPSSKAETASTPAAVQTSSIAPGDPRHAALTEYETKKAAVTGDAGAQKALALWCDSHGLWNEAKTHWQAIVDLDPKNEEARRRLGFRLRDGRWVPDAAREDEVAQKKADSYWSKELATQHKRMHQKGRDAARIQEEAVAHIDAVGDPRAAPSIWKVFAGDPSHHVMTVRLLGRFQTVPASRMLAALAVYSRDDKARRDAVEALRGRRPADFAAQLVSVLNAPLRYEVRGINLPGGKKGRLMFIEGQEANYEFLYPTAAEPVGFCARVGVYQRPLRNQEIASLRQFNQNQAAMAKAAVDQQIQSDKQAVEQLNSSIRALNERVVGILNTTCNARLRPDPEDGRRWLASIAGKPYVPPSARPKPTIAQVVSPLYSPSFVPVPAPS